MAVVKQRWSPAQTRALAALSQYGYIAEPTGSWANIPLDAQVPRRTRDALLKRGVGREGVVIVGVNSAEWSALLADGTPDRQVIEQPRLVTYDLGAQPTLTVEAHGQVAKFAWQNYSVAMYRDPNSGDMRFDIDVPIGAECDIAVDVNDERVYP